MRTVVSPDYEHQRGITIRMKSAWMEEEEEGEKTSSGKPRWIENLIAYMHTNTWDIRILWPKGCDVPFWIGEDESLDLPSACGWMPRCAKIESGTFFEQLDMKVIHSEH